MLAAVPELLADSEEWILDEPAAVALVDGEDEDDVSLLLLSSPLGMTPSVLLAGPMELISLGKLTPLTDRGPLVRVMFGTLPCKLTVGTTTVVIPYTPYPRLSATPCEQSFQHTALAGRRWHA